MAESHVVTAQVLGCLATAHPYPEWSSFQELRILNGSRRIDFWTISAYPSGAYRAVAYEVKATRADFLNELKHPEKRLDAEECAHECWFAMPTGIAKPEEIPENWGLMVMSEGMRFRRVKQATQREIGPLPHYLTAAVARAATGREQPTDRRLWRAAGKDLTEQDLIELAADLAIKDTERRRKDIERQAVEDFKQDRKYEEADDLRFLVWNMTGARTADEFRAWFDRRNGLALAPQQRQMLDKARVTLATLAEFCNALAGEEAAE